MQRQGQALIPKDKNTQGLSSKKQKSPRATRQNPKKQMNNFYRRGGGLATNKKKYYDKRDGLQKK